MNRRRARVFPSLAPIAPLAPLAPLASLASLGAFAALTSLAVLVPTTARAADPAARGWVFLADGQASAVFANGYPSNAQQLGDASNYVSTGAMGGGQGTFAVLSSFHPRVAFGLWGSYGGTWNDLYVSKGGGGGVRVELLPFAEGWLAPVGFHGAFGVGTATVMRRDGTGHGADATQSFVSFGAFRDVPFVTFETFGHGHLTWGPSLGYDLIFSRDFARHSANAGLRITFATLP